MKQVTTILTIIHNILHTSPSGEGQRLRHPEQRHSLARLLLPVFLLGFALYACDDYDSFTDDRSTTLSFSRDTIVFDTLIATIPSATQTLAVYNRGDKGLRISEVWLERGDDSPFRVNIDGQDLTQAYQRHASDFELRRRDSIIVRIEVTLPESQTDNPTAHTDALRFRLESGVEQRVELIATALDAFFMRGVVITKDTTLSSRRPIIVYDSLIVAPDVTLRLEAGTRMLFHEGAGLTVHGRLLASGSLESPIVFRTDRTDHIFDYLPYDRLPSRWEGLRFTASSLGNDLNYVDIHGGNFGIICDSTGVDAPKLTLTNCRIYEVGGDGVRLTDCRSTISNCEISNTLGHTLCLVGGNHTCTHCTLAQFYVLSYLRGYALYITNVRDGVYHPLTGATFDSCVITGYDEDVVQGEWIDVTAMSSDEAATIGTPQDNFLFDHCFLATEIPTEGDYAARFVACIYDDPEAELNRDKHFTLFDTHTMTYDFTPVEASPIRGTANPLSRDLFPYDLRGRSRHTDEQPDAGAYEFVKATEN